ncbi:MAG: proton-conducting transporter membrane subunit [Anaerolineae bacterium]|jgi:NADH-quinone oxidoreductase subunit L
MSILNLAWLIPLFPFLAFAAIAIFAYRSRRLSHRLVIGGIAIAFVLSQIVFWRAVTLPVGGGEHAFDESISIPWLSAGVERLGLGVYIDPAAAVMLFMVPLVCMMIFIYSVGYMNFGTPQVDPRYSRFFCYLALFATGMLGLVVFNNLLALFIFWEIMGTCSYLLIGFWYEKDYPDPDKITPREAGLKAFIVTKIGDLFFMLGLALLYSEVGSLAYRDIFAHETLEHLANTPFLGTSWSMATAIALLLFGGTVGKSAQFPLHVWLPDAMEGPTPVSALIHAATMVSAGVFLLVRAFPIIAVMDASALTIGSIPFIAFIGAFTALFSSIMAVAQDDIKGVLAFSTISQLGYMVAALGLGTPLAYAAGTFHLITHAFFKALLFLGSGSVIHGMEHGHHHVHEHAEHDTHGQHEEDNREWFNPNDMMNMGGLAKKQPITFWTFLVGGLALSGFPLITAGFWSKDEVLAQTYASSPGVFWILAVAAGLTAFYTMRQICLTFAGEPRTKAAEHAPESVYSMTVPLIILAVFAVSLGWAGIPEHFPVIGGLIPNWFEHFIGSTIEAGGHAVEHAGRVAGHLHLAQGEATSHSQLPLIMGLTFGLGGLALGWLVYGWKPLKAGEMDRVEAAMRKVKLGWLHKAMRNRFYFDELYQAIFVKPAIWLAQVFDRFDYGQPEKVEVEGEIVLNERHGVVDGLVNLAGKVGKALSYASGWLDANIVDGLVDLVGRFGVLGSEAFNVFDLSIVDGAVDGVGDVVKAGGRRLRPIQTGRVQDYLLLASLVVLALVVTFFLM